jgi:hypothetical protein
MLLLIGARCAQSDAQWCLLVQVRFEYEFHDEEGKWFRAHGNEVQRLFLLKRVAYVTQVSQSACASSKQGCRTKLQYVLTLGCTTQP